MAGGYISFAEVKQRVPIVEVLRRYELLETLRERGEALVGPCPIHGGKSQTVFKVTPARNIWFCFGCERQGREPAGANILGLVAAMEEITVRAAAERLSEWFLRVRLSGRQKRSNLLASAPASCASSNRSSATSWKRVAPTRSSSS